MAFDFKELTRMEDMIGAYDVYKHCMYMPTEEKYESRIICWLQDKKIKAYACLDGSVIKGMIVVSITELGKAEILGIAVEPPSRGQGIGSYMLRQICDRHRIVELCAETDGGAVAFYQKNGFSITEFIKAFDGNSITRYSCVFTDHPRSPDGRSAF